MNASEATSMKQGVVAANRIIVIEDDPAILSGLEAALRMESYEVLTAADGEAGYHLVRDQRPDLVILDLMLPKMNGYEICRQIRSNGIVTPILMLTAQDHESHRVQGFEAGADDYVTKPFSLRELLGRVRAILRRSEGRSDLANQRELDEARRVQERLMPAEIPQVAGLQISGKWQPARIAGGDYFDVIPLREDVLAICIADVCGKGMPAAMMMSNLQAAVRSQASAELRPAQLCGHLNTLMCRNFSTHGFITFFYAVLDVTEKRLRYCNAGHNPPFFASGNRLSLLDRGGAVLGVIDGGRYEDSDLEFKSGDRLLMYTDGVTECCNATGEEYGESRL